MVASCQAWVASGFFAAGGISLTLLHVFFLVKAGSPL